MTADHFHKKSLLRNLKVLTSCRNREKIEHNDKSSKTYRVSNRSLYIYTYIYCNIHIYCSESYLLQKWRRSNAGWFLHRTLPSPLSRHLPPPYGRFSFLYFLHARRNGRHTHDPPRTTIHWNSIHDGGSSSAGTFGPSRIFFVITRADQAKEFVSFRRFREFARNKRSSVTSAPMLMF